MAAPPLGSWLFRTGETRRHVTFRRYPCLTSPPSTQRVRSDFAAHLDVHLRFDRVSGTFQDGNRDIVTSLKKWFGTMQS
jgi:hypothetical protein